MKPHGPVLVDSERGFPPPDAAFDPCGPDPSRRGWLAWAAIQQPGCYLALFTCEKGHTWTVWYYEVTAPADEVGLKAFPISPYRIVPSADSLARIGIRGDVQITVIDWSQIFLPPAEEEAL